ncbi:NAD(+) diphosphatase [Loktanella sp. IMCC34160]|uniref:NAD(+) diphosphatase n=1 Tax=Loktanella sp. IMCC34160 TaxID=2510646 RepID=UPI00101C838F|nr:NAD(+) diphosphatase [Loktanella sp. IMCC34160]RYG91564.1 NAD(+) diphosphatase [Loktanella sp. IMCC34160]
MKQAETVTFGGSGLDRAAHLRGDDTRLDPLRRDPDSRAIVLWRGKPLVVGPDGGALARVGLDSALCRAASSPMIFLGLDHGRAVFAADISGWVPDTDSTPDPSGFLDPSLQRHPDAPQDAVFAELRSIMTSLGARDAELAATAKAIFGWHETHLFCSRCGAPSAMAMAGWQRNCPTCGGQHFPRTDPVVIMLITRGNSVLLGRSPGWPDGMYSCLAGFVEPGEPIEAAVRREVLEEAGIRVGQVDYLASQPWAFPTSLMFGCKGEALTEEIILDPAELEDALWATREEIAKAFIGQHPKIRPARKGSIAHFLLWNWLSDQLT